MNQKICPCGSQKPVDTCCQPFLLGKANPSTPDQLMRSRYTAFVEGNIDYLIATHHPSQRSTKERDTLAKTIQETEWLGLRVLSSDFQSDSQVQGVVEFVAFYGEKQYSTEGGLTKMEPKHEVGLPSQLHERSEFIKQDGQWFYTQGLTLPPIKIARNDPCWCGSGKKYKQCHARGK
ncbi:MAG: YchJ family metal-binding protein [Chloroflexota bacterium]